MRNKSTLNHAQRNAKQREAYSEVLIPSSTYDPDKTEILESEGTVPASRMGEPESLSPSNKTDKDDKPPKIPYRSGKTKWGNFFKNSGIPGVLGTILLSIMGFVCLTLYSNNRELGEIKTKVDNLQNELGTLKSMDSSQGNRQADFDKEQALLKKDIDFIKRRLNISY